MSADSIDELRAQRLRQRLWGATIVIALAVIFLPLLLDGSGSESQFRRVERLREEPPRVINIDGSRETVTVPEAVELDQDSWWERTKRRFTENPPEDARVRRTTDTDEAAIPVAPADSPEGTPTDAAAPSVDTEPTQPTENTEPGFGAWVVQAGSFREEVNALAVRDRLRRAGYPSFVTLNDTGEVFRVRVGPMIDKDQATNVRENIMSLLGRDALVMPYP